MGLCAGFKTQDGAIVLVDRTSSATLIHRTSSLDSAMTWETVDSVSAWFDKLNPDLLDRIAKHKILLFADHDLTIPPIGELSFEQIAERRDYTKLWRIDFDPLPVCVTPDPMR